MYHARWLTMSEHEHQVPIEGQSHWCDGHITQRRLVLTDGGFRRSAVEGIHQSCNNVVGNDSDHCAAGHWNKVRPVQYRAVTEQPSAENQPEASLETEVLVNDLASMWQREAAEALRGLAEIDAVRTEYIGYSRDARRCIFCGATTIEDVLEHNPSCPWVKARGILGISLEPIAKRWTPPPVWDEFA
jgi:hypothetical protein